MSKYAENETLPHKKAGKNHNKPSPNKRGCEKNDHQPHDFANFQPVYFSTLTNRYEFSDSYITRCVDCGKRQSRRAKRIKDTPIAQVAFFKDGYWEVEVNKRQSGLHRISKLNW